MWPSASGQNSLIWHNFYRSELDYFGGLFSIHRDSVESKQCVLCVSGLTSAYRKHRYFSVPFRVVVVRAVYTSHRASHKGGVI